MSVRPDDTEQCTPGLPNTLVTAALDLPTPTCVLSTERLPTGTAPDLRIVGFDEFAFPEAGEPFLGFQLDEELGRGTAGRVFLGRQPAMANRPVVIKVTQSRATEVEALARLRHTNIVPIYSAHEGPSFRAICMPYYGRVTLAAALARVREGKGLPSSGSFFLELVRTEAGVPSLAIADNTLGRLDYVDGVLWLCARLADGLAHAHERDLIHCDLKPANVLLTNDGQPVLLDFDVALDVRAAGDRLTEVGGTLQYMSTDQLELLLGRREKLDGRSDVYSLGMILFELLTGRVAFEPPDEPIRPELERALVERQNVPRVRLANPAVSKGVEAIVFKCLAPNAADRYASAAALAEDINCHLSHRSLVHAREFSLWERARKWAHRNPKLASPAMGVALASVFILSAGMVIVGDRERAHAAELAEKRDAAVEHYRRHIPAIVSAQATLLDASTVSAGQAGREKALAALAAFDLPHNPNWVESPNVRLLPASDRDQLITEVGSLLYLLARPQPGGPGDPALTRLQRNLHALAAACVPHARFALARQAVDLAANRPAPPQRLPSPHELNSLDQFLVAAELVQAGRYGEALPFAEAFSMASPAAYGGWMLQGICNSNLGRDSTAAGNFSACIAVQGERPDAFFRRAQAYFRLQDYAAARADFDMSAKLDADRVDARIGSARSCQQLREYQAGIDVLEPLFGRESPPVKAFVLRARLHELVGNVAKCAADLEQAMRRTPTDDEDWVERGLSRYRTAPEQALEDFRKAEAINPRSYQAMHNQAFVLMDKLLRPEEALVVLNRELTLFPDIAASLVTRGIVYARLGQTEAAIRDADRALALDARANISFGVGCIYAILSTQKEEHGVTAIGYLGSALRGGYDTKKLDEDPDLTPIRNWPEFESLLRAARTLQTAARPGR